MPTKAELKHLANLPKMKIRKGDSVMIISGKDKGQTGVIFAASPKEQKVIVVQYNSENPDEPIPLNAVIKHKKAKSQGEKSARIKLPAALHVSNVMLLDPKTSDPTRVGRKVEGGKILRYAKKSGTIIHDTPYEKPKD